MRKYKLMRKNFSMLLITSMLIGAGFISFGNGGMPVFADAYSALTDNESNVTITADEAVDEDVFVSKKTVTIEAGATLTVKSGAKLTIDTDTCFIVNGALIFENGAQSDIKGTVRINSGGTLSDENNNADWTWSHGDFTGDIYIQRYAKLILNNSLYVGEKEDDAYITVMAGTWAADNDSSLDRLRIHGKTDIYAYNGVTSINKTITEIRTWHLGSDTHINLCADNSIQFIGPDEDMKARINTYDPINSKYYNVANNAEGCNFTGNKNYSWVGAGGSKQWLMVGPYVDYASGGINMEAFMNLVNELGMTKYDMSSNHGGSSWNGVSWNGEGVPTNDSGVDGIRYRDIKYTDRGGSKNGIDLYVPAGYKQGDDIPFIIHMYGGGWTSGSKKSEESICARFAKMGYAVAAIDYRLAGYSSVSGFEQDNGIFMDMIDDIEDGVKAAKKKLEELGYTSTRMATTGGSAGAHLSMMYAYTHGENTTDRFGNENVLIPVKLCMTNCGPSDFSWMSWQHSSTYVSYIKMEEDENGEAKAVLDDDGNLVYNNDEEQAKAGASLAVGLLMINEALELPEQEDSESDEAYQERVKVFTDKFTEEEFMPWTDKAQAVNMRIAPAAMIRDAIMNPETSIYHNVTTIGLYGGQDTLCHGDNTKNLTDALALDADGGHYIVFSYLMGHTLLEDYSAILDNYNKTNEYLELYLREGKKQVVFKTDEQTVARFIVESGASFSEADFPSIPEKEAYSIIGWDINKDSLVNIVDNITVTAEYLAESFKIEFMSEGAVIDEKTVEYGGKLLDIPDVPEKSGHTGVWDITDFSFIKEDMTVNTVFTSIPCSITFMNDNETVAVKTVSYGEALLDIPALPKKDGYEAAWDTSDYSSIVEDMVVNAVFTPVQENNSVLISVIIVATVLLLLIAILFIVKKMRTTKR